MEFVYPSNIIIDKMIECDTPRHGIVNRRLGVRSWDARSDNVFEVGVRAWPLWRILRYHIYPLHDKKPAYKRKTTEVVDTGKTCVPKPSIGNILAVQTIVC